MSLDPSGPKCVSAWSERVSKQTNKHNTHDENDNENDTEKNRATLKIVITKIIGNTEQVSDVGFSVIIRVLI